MVGNIKLSWVFLRISRILFEYKVGRLYKPQGDIWVYSIVRISQKLALHQNFHSSQMEILEDSMLKITRESQLLFEVMFYFGICKDSRVFPCTLRPAAVDNILPWCMCRSWELNISSWLLTKLQIWFGFRQFLQGCCSSVPGTGSAHPTAFSRITFCRKTGGACKLFNYKITISLHFASSQLNLL